MGSKCSVCGNVTFPQERGLSAMRKARHMEEYHIYRGGKLNTFSIVNAALPGFKTPSIQAYIDLEEGPRIWSILTDVEPDEKGHQDRDGPGADRGEDEGRCARQ